MTGFWGVLLGAAVIAVTLVCCLAEILHALSLRDPVNEDWYPADYEVDE